MKKPIINTNGLTIKELIEYLKKFPEDGEVWIMTKRCISNVAKEACRLNQKDVVLSINPDW